MPHGTPPLDDHHSRSTEANNELRAMGLRHSLSTRHCHRNPESHLRRPFHHISRSKSNSSPLDQAGFEPACLGFLVAGLTTPSPNCVNSCVFPPRRRSTSLATSSDQTVLSQERQRSLRTLRGTSGLHGRRLTPLDGLLHCSNVPVVPVGNCLLVSNIPKGLDRRERHL
jgi:hypothetical protein